jgi:hypothetical protein
MAVAVLATVGTIIVARHPRHPIGWIYLLGALASGVGDLALSVAQIGGGLPGIWVAWWLKTVLGDVPVAVIVSFPLLLFPNGKLPSPRWRPALACAVAGVLLWAASWALMPGHFDGSVENPVNPLGITGTKGFLDQADSLGLFALGVVAFAAIVSLFARFRRSDGVERQQLKWLAWAGVWTIVVLFVAGPGTYGGTFPDPLIDLLQPVMPYLFPFAIAIIPGAMAVSILRYRLYDIDRIISRTVGYSILTIVLGAGYLGIVLGLQPATRTITGGGDLVVAVSTLCVAAAFVPLQRRVQARVDRRFNRARYNAERTMDAFVARLRDKIDLAELGTDLAAVVGTTMQPAHFDLWLAGQKGDVVDPSSMRPGERRNGAVTAVQEARAE